MTDYRFKPTTKDAMLDMVNKQMRHLEKMGRGYLRLESLKWTKITNSYGETMIDETHWYTRVYLTKSSKGYRATFKKGLYGGLEPEVVASYQTSSPEELKQKVTRESLGIIN